MPRPRDLTEKEIARLRSGARLSSDPEVQYPGISVFELPNGTVLLTFLGGGGYVVESLEEVRLQFRRSRDRKLPRSLCVGLPPPAGIEAAQAGLIGDLAAAVGVASSKLDLSSDSCAHFRRDLPWSEDDPTLFSKMAWYASTVLAKKLGGRVELRAANGEWFPWIVANGREFEVVKPLWEEVFEHPDQPLDVRATMEAVLFAVFNNPFRSRQ